MAIVRINQDNFKEEVLAADVPVLVDFFATWCGPCKVIAPTLEDLAGENEGSAKICKLDIDELPDIASEYGVMSVPTLIVFKQGKEVDRAVGALPKEQLQTLLS